jgi:predicted dehydrogenase
MITRREFIASTAAAPLLVQDAPPLRLGMLGMWHSHAPGIVSRVAENPKEFELVGFYDPDPAVVADRSQAWAPKLPGFKVFEKPEQLLAEKLDGVVVESRVYENLKLARMALESGRPVMLEKPAGTNLEEHRALLDLARAKKLHVQMIYLFRYLPAARELLSRKAELGALYEFRGRLSKDLPGYARNVAECGRYKGGIFFEMAGHAIDLMVALLGAPRTVAPFLAHHHAAEPSAFIDHGISVFGFEKAWGLVEVPALEVVPKQRRFELYGTGGALVIPHLPDPRIEVCPKGGKWTSIDLPSTPGQLADLREFAAVTGGRKAPEFSMDHDLAVQEALLKACGM